MLRFITTLFLSTVLVLAVNGQTSLNERTAFWTTAANWSEGTMPGPGTRSVGTITLNGKTIVINGTVKSLDNITANESNIIVSAGDTLVINGNLTLSSNASITNNGVLIVFGNVLNTDSRMLVSGAGKMVVAGHYTGDQSLSNSFIGPMYIFDSTNITPIPPKDADLHIKDLPLYNYVHNMKMVLPIELAYFQATLQHNQVELKWKTVTELNNDYFLVERSSDGIHFDVVERVTGAGNSRNTLDYIIFDRNPLHGKSYYRLSQVDFDGQKTQFNVVSVLHDREISLQLYPNPTTDFVYFTGSDSNYSVTLRDANGHFRLDGIQTTEVEQGKFGIDLTQLDPGVYFVIVKVSDTASPSAFRIVKM